MEQFKITPEGIEEIGKKILVKTLSLTLLSMAACFIVPFFQYRLAVFDARIAPFALGMLGFLAYSTFGAAKKRKKLLETFTLTFADRVVTRTQQGLPAIAIAYHDLQEIVRNSDGSFWLKGRSINDSIGIPAQIGDRARLERLLEGIMPLVEHQGNSLAQRFGPFLGIAVIPLLLAVFYASDKLVVGLCGLVVVGGLGYSFVQIQRSRHMEARTKKASWAVLFVMAVLLFTIYSKLAR